MRKIAVLGVALLLTVAVSSCSLMRRATDEGAGGYSSSKPSATSTRTSSPRATWTPATRTPQTSASSSKPTPNAGTTRVRIAELKVGDCIGLIIGTTVKDVPKVPCSQPHYHEVFSKKVVPGTTYPGESALDKTADAHCQAAFLTYVGIRYEASKLRFSTTKPSASAWTTGNRSITCFVRGEDGRTTGTLKNSKR